MMIKDMINSPVWLIWVMFGLFLVISIVLLTGHGTNLIAGYNTAGKEEKSWYNTKKICRVVVSTGMAVIDCVVIAILVNTVCKNRD